MQKTLSQQNIISMMAELQSSNVHFIIAPPETDFIIGSNTINTPTDLYVVSVNSISSEDSKREKKIIRYFSFNTCFSIFSNPISLP